MSAFQLAQANVARARYALEDPRMAGFTNRLEQINALAEGSPGFVWRYVDESGNATDTRVLDDPDRIFNMSVWESLEALAQFAYRSDHRELLRARHDWFHPADAPMLALWWVPAGHRPSVAEGEQALWRIQRAGPSAPAFDFAHRFDPPAQPRRVAR